MTIQFIKEHTTRDGRAHRIGEVLLVNDLVGAALIQDGIAKERPQPSPKETKAKAKPDKKTKAAEPEEDDEAPF